jgi:MFS family permease
VNWRGATEGEKVWWSISGLIFQLIAGICLALPYVSPRTMQKIDRAWHEGRGKRWVAIGIYVIIAIIVLVIFGVSISTNHYPWFIWLFCVFLETALVIYVWMYFVKLRFERLFKRLPKRLQRGKCGEDIRYEKCVSANRYICIWALIGWVVSGGAIYVIYTQFKNLTSLPWFQILVLVLIFIGAFSLSTFLLAGLYLILDKISNVISKRFKKPLWATVLFIFVVGCLLQITGVVVRG